MNERKDVKIDVHLLNKHAPLPWTGKEEEVCDDNYGCCNMFVIRDARGWEVCEFDAYTLTSGKKRLDGIANGELILRCVNA